MASELFMLSTPVERGDELVRFVSSCVKDGAVLSALADAAASANWSQLVTLSLEQNASFFKTSSADEVEGAFTLMLSLFSLMPEEAQRPVVERMVSAATSAADAKSSIVRMRILVNLYNIVSARALKFEVFSRIVQFAAETKNMDVLAPYLSAANSWQAKWGLSQREAGELFLLVSSSLERAGLAEEAQAFLIRYLQTYETEPAAKRVEARSAAKTAAINFVRAPAVSQCSSLASLAVVQDMAGDAELKRLQELVDIFSHKSLDAYLAFQAGNAAYLTELGVDNASSTDTMRLLTLCTLAAGADMLTYAAVASSLQVPVAEVESWVVRAISLGLIDARMDQLAAELTVLRSVQREFNASQWKTLQSKLHAWRDMAKDMTSTLERR